MEQRSGDHTPGQHAIVGAPRAACVLTSMAGLMAGTIATFTTENEIGTGALLFVGVLAGVAAILQRIPRIKMGDTEIDPTQIFAAGVHTGADAVADATAEAALMNKSPEEIAATARKVEGRLSRAIWERFPATREVLDDHRQQKSEATAHD